MIKKKMIKKVMIKKINIKMKIDLKIDLGRTIKKIDF